MADKTPAELELEDSLRSIHGIGEDARGAAAPEDDDPEEDGAQAPERDAD